MEVFIYILIHIIKLGTILTGTVLNGQAKLNDVMYKNDNSRCRMADFFVYLTKNLKSLENYEIMPLNFLSFNSLIFIIQTIEIPSLKVEKKIKSMQMFRKPVDHAAQGDRLGICVTNFDAKLIERGIACSPDYVKNTYGVLIKLNKIKHFKGVIETNSKFHISIGHETVIGKIELFAELEENGEKQNIDLAKLNINDEQFDFNKEYKYVNEIDNNEPNESNTKVNKIKNYYLLIDFTDQMTEQSVLCTMNALVIGSKLDTDIHLNQCRIAFYGRVLYSFINKEYRSNGDLARLKVFKEKSKEGIIERMTDAYTVIGKSLFKKETNLDLFVNLKVELSTGEKGLIEGNFGQSGKFKIRIPSK